ncbi:MAG TPA: flagellar filament capping protein FliD, partial [Planctomycetota bacterium]|nr:flagellar filament capping protein FliD [Planctomycetota bacterium]
DINGQGLDLTAVVVNTGQGATPYKLVMTSRQTGEDNAVTVSANTSGLTFSDLTVARNSVINFGATNPIQIESATNTVTSLAPGLTLELKDTSAAPISVVVSGDTSGVTAKAQDFVTKYNAVMSMISKYSRYDTENSKAAELFGNSTLRYLQQDLALAISTVVDSQPAETNSLTMVGFSLDSGGTLSLDEATFAEALADNADGVTGLFSAVTNRALASNGGGISGPAGEPGFDVNDLIDGSADSEDFGAGDGFMTSALPASFTVTFDRARDISQLILRTINSAAMPSADFGVSDFSFELQSSGGAWSTVKSVAGFTGAASLFSLDRPQSAVAMRVTVSGTNAADGMVRLLELSANEEEGVAHKVSNVLDQVTRYGDGQIATEQTSLDEKISSMEKQIEDMQARLDAKETRLRAEFTAMESAMAKMQTQSQQFLAQINGSSSS